MAAVLTGTPVAITWASGANPAGQSITIPSDATAVVMCAAFWASTQPSGLSSATLNGNAPSRNGQLETGQLTGDAPATMYAIWDAPATGSRTLDPAWTVSPDEGPTCIVFFVKDCDVAANWNIQLDHDEAGSAVSVSLTTESGELCIAFDAKEGSAPSNSSGWTSAQTHSNNSYASRLKYISASGASEVVNSENEAYSGLIGFAIPAGAVGEDDPTITDVDTDEVVLDGQTSVAVTGTDMGADETERTFTLRQGSTSVPQTETGSGTDTAATLTIGIEQSGADIKFGSATLRVTRTDDDAYGEIAITVNPPTGQLYVDIGTPDSEADNRITAVDDIASGDQLQARGEGGGAVPTGLNLESDGTFWFEDGETPTAFDVRVWDASDATWGAWATQGMAGTGVTVDAGFDSLAITEQAASVRLSRHVAAGTDSLAITEQAATVKLSRAVAAGLDTLAVSEQQAVVRLARHISASVDTLTLTEPAAQVHTGTGIAAGLDALTLAEHAAQVSAGTGISAGFDSLTLTELQASVAQGTGIAAGFDGLSLAEQVATLRLAKAISASVDALVVTERQAAVSSGLQLSAGIDELVISEQAALVNREREIAAGLDALAVTERQALIGLARDITAGVDSLLLAEQSAVVAIGRAILAGFDQLTIAEQQAIVQGQSAVIEVVAQRIVRVAARNSVVTVH